MALTATGVQAADHFWTVPINSDVENVTIANDEPLGNYGFYTYSYGKPLQRHAQWDVGYFSTMASPSPRERFQASIAPSACGSTSVQLNGHQASMHLHSWSLPSPSPMGWHHLAWNRTVNANAWNSQQIGSNPKFCVEQSQAVVSAYSEGAPQYTGISVWLLDKNNNYIELQAKTWDNRGMADFKEGIAYDAGLQSHHAGTYYGANSRFITLLPYSNSATDQIWSAPRWYGMCITLQNLANVIVDRNSKAPNAPPMSLDYSSYKVTNVVVHAEIVGLATANRPRANGRFTTRAAGIYTYTRY